MKKTIALILIVAILVSLVGCGNQTNTSIQQEPIKEETNETTTETAITNKSIEEIYLQSDSQNRYFPGDVITKVGTENRAIFTVMADGHLFRDFTIKIETEGIVDLVHNGAGNIIGKNISEGVTSFTIVTENEEYTFYWSSIRNSDKVYEYVAINQDSNSQEKQNTSASLKTQSDIHDYLCAADELYILKLIDVSSFDKYGNPIYGVEETLNQKEYDAIISRLLTGNSDEEKDTILTNLGLKISDYVGMQKGKVYFELASYLEKEIETDHKLLIDTIAGITDEILWHWKNVKNSQGNYERARNYYSNNQKAADIKQYSIPAELGTCSMTYNEALSFVGRAAFIIQNRVQSIPDLLMYSIAAGFGSIGEAFTPWYGKDPDNWGADWSGEVQLSNGWPNCCGGYANYVSFLLKGDYDEQGWIQHLGDDKHHFNWIKEGEKYYIFDLSGYDKAGHYNYQSRKIIECDNLQDFFDNKWDGVFADKTLLTQVYYAIEDGDFHPGNFNSKKLIYPKDLEGKMGFLYVKEGYKDYITFEDPKTKIPGYNTFTYVAPSGKEDRIKNSVEKNNSLKSDVHLVV